MLPTLLRIGASNAVTAALLAVAVAVMCRIAGRPALARALWVLVLVKLLTPPLWSVPLDGLLARSANARAPQPSELSTASPLPTTMDDTDINDTELTRPIDGNGFEPTRDVNFALTTASSPSDITVVETSRVDWVLVGNVIAVVWGIGTAVCLIVVFRRVWRFSRLLHKTTVAPSIVQARCETLAQRIGLRKAPQVRLTRSAVCPSLWAFSRPAVILAPQSLWNRLDAAQQDSLLVHELAHLRRRDHWVRLLELAATLVYWWHPVVWFARRRLHEAEEQCCDAWVLGALPASGKSYASALLEAIDFISTPHAATPALASGLGDFTSLKRRIVMIQNGSVRKALSWTGAVAVLVLAGIVLPVAPSFGQESPKAENTEKPQRVLFLTQDDKGGGAEADKGAPDQREAARAELEAAIKQAHSEVEQLSAEMAKIHAALEQATARLKKLEAAHASGDAPAIKARVLFDTANPKVAQYYRLKSDLSRGDRLDRIERQVEQIMVELKQLRAADQVDAAKKNFDEQRAEKR